MDPAPGGRRTRIRKTRPDRKKRHYKSRPGTRYEAGYPPNGGNVAESTARPKLELEELNEEAE